MTVRRFCWPLLALACAALAACGGRPAILLPLHAAPVVPWLDAAAPNLAKPFTVAGVAACTSAGLEVTVHVADPSYVNGGPANTSFWVITVSDKDSRPCFVTGLPAITFVAARQKLDIPRNPADSTMGLDVVYLGAHQTGAAPYFPRASGEITVTPCVLHGVDTVDVDFGVAHGLTTVNDIGPPGGTGPACQVPQETYSAFLQGERDDATATTIAHTQATISAPSVVSPGDVLHFTVTISNRPPAHHQVALALPTPNPTLTWHPCPTYHVELEGVPGSLRSYRLNCAAAAAIAGDSAETFAMEYTVPADAAPGPSTLLWGIDGDPATFAPARWNLQIT